MPTVEKKMVAKIPKIIISKSGSVLVTSLVAFSLLFVHA